MTRKIRRIIFIVLSLFFLIITPVVLLYSIGYSFDREKKKIVKTGAFYFKSYPEGAEIFLNEKSKGKTPKLIKRLLLRDYQVKICAKGFLCWNKKLRIQPQLVAEARNIYLIPQDIKPALVKENLFHGFSLKNEMGKKETSSNSQNLHINPQNNILYKTNGADPVRSLSSNGTNQFVQLSIEPLPETEKSYQIIISSNGQYIALLSDSLYILDPRDKKFKLLAENILGAQFSPDNKKLLYFSNNEIWAYFLEDDTSPPQKKAGDKEFITRFSEKIKQAVWFSKTNQHIIFLVQTSQKTENDLLKFIELDSRDQRNIFDIIPVSPVRKAEITPADGTAGVSNGVKNSQIYYSYEEEILYFTSKNNLYKIKL